MSNYIVQQQDIDLLRQSSRQLYCKLELLNYHFKVIDSIEGNLISDSYNNDSSSDIRRTYSAELHISNSSFFIGSDKKVWIDKYVRPYIGIVHERTQQIIWYLIGTFVFNDTNYSFDSTTHTLSLSCSDLMCMLNGDKGGQIEGLTNTISEGSYTRDVMISLLGDAGITKYCVDDIGKTIPYDLEYSVGTTYYDILKEIIELYAGYEMFFDTDGTFIVQAIPTCKNDNNVLDEKIINPLVISEESSKSFNNIYNVTEIWGSVIDTDYYTQISSSVDGISYIATLPDNPTKLDSFGKYCVHIPIINNSNPTLNLNNLGARKIMEDDGQPIKSGRLLANTDYVFKYRKATDDFLLMGQYQAYGEYKQTDSDSPFSTVNLGYEIKQILQFDELSTDSLCEQRAKYETWLSTRMLDSITLKMVAIPFLDVNWKISYQSIMTGITKDYIVKSISGSNSDFTMSITLITFSELYPDIIPESR